MIGCTSLIFDNTSIISLVMMGHRFNGELAGAFSISEHDSICLSFNYFSVKVPLNTQGHVAFGNGAHDHNHFLVVDRIRAEVEGHDLR